MAPIHTTLAKFTWMWAALVSHFSILLLSDLVWRDLVPKPYTTPPSPAYVICEWCLRAMQSSEWIAFGFNSLIFFNSHIWLWIFFSGSCKLDGHCTSSMIVRRTIFNEKVCVTFYPTHYNHEINFETILSNQMIPQVDKDKIASKF